MAMEKWIDEVKKSPKELPVLNGLLKAREHAEETTNEALKLKRRTAIKAILVSIAGYSTVSRALSKVVPPKPVGRLGMAKRTLLSGLATYAGNLADIASTEGALKTIETYLKRIGNTREFVALPEKVKEKLVPPPYAFEQNPFVRHAIKTKGAAALAPKTVFQDATREFALAHAAALAAGRPKHAAYIATALFALHFGAALHNSSGAVDLQNAKDSPKSIYSDASIKRELELLGKILNKHGVG